MPLPCVQVADVDDDVARKTRKPRARAARASSSSLIFLRLPLKAINAAILQKGGKLRKVIPSCAGQNVAGFDACEHAAKAAPKLCEPPQQAAPARGADRRLPCKAPLCPQVLLRHAAAFNVLGRSAKLAADALLRVDKISKAINAYSARLARRLALWAFSASVEFSYLVARQSPQALVAGNVKRAPHRASSGGGAGAFTSTAVRRGTKSPDCLCCCLFLPCLKGKCRYIPNTLDLRMCQKYCPCLCAS